MNTYIRYILLLLPLLAVTACQQNGLSDPEDLTAPAGTYRSRLEVQTDIADAEAYSQDPEVTTRGVVDGTSMTTSGQTYGLIVCKHEDSPANYEIYDESKLYGNIKAQYYNYNSQGIKWWYSYENTSDYPYQPLYLVTDDPSKHLDIYAYAPWKTGVTIQSGFDYDLRASTQDAIVDPMYATYEGNSNLAITKDATLTPTIHFHHALARIVLHLKLAIAQNTGVDGWHAMRLYQIQLLHKTGASTPLYTQGNMNLLTGAVTTSQIKSQAEQTLTCATEKHNSGYVNPDQWDIYQSDTYKTFNMLVHPTPYQADGDFSLKFWFDGVTLSTALIHTYDIRRSDLLHSDGTTYGFQPGYAYHFYFILDNYIHLQNVKISEWSNTDETEIQI